MSTPKETKTIYLQVCTDLKHEPNKELLFILDQATLIHGLNPIKNFQLRLHGNKRNEKNEMYRKRLDHQDTFVLCQLLLENSFVVSLDLGYNVIGDEGAKTIGNFIKDPRTFLQQLVLSYNDIGQEGCKEIAVGLQMNETLRSLTLDGNKVGRMGGLAIAGALQVNFSLEELNMSDTDLNNQALIAFTTVLKGNSTLKKLDLGRPLLASEQEETTVHVGRMLEVNTRLEELHLSKHVMKNFGVERLIEHMKYNRTLLHLNLSCNKISRDGVGCIASFLKTNPPLKHLNLAYNRMEDQGALWLSEALDTNVSLNTLVICSNSLTDIGLCAIAKLLHTNPTVVQLYIWGNHIGEGAARAFMELTQGDVPRLCADHVDVRAYVVDDVPYLARVTSPY